MNPERWQQITSIFQVALQRDASSRAAYLNEACAGDDSLRREVDAMLASHEQASRFIEEPALNVAARQSGNGPSLIGQSIAHYQVLSLLGSGGMGDVYLALDTKLGRKVALKLLPEYLASDTQRARLFTKEARAASALNHPNIITIDEIGQLADRYYIAMEYVEGETLRSHIHRDRTPLPRLLKYLQQVAEGLTKAHANGIVHRDLKPDNIMITRDGYAKILDFGLAKLTEQPNRSDVSASSEAATALLTPPSISGVVMGTAGYMSPEQAQGKTAQIDHRSDIFSFGCILFEAATGMKAFDGADVIDSLHKIVHGPTPSIKDASTNLPADLDRIVRRCLAKDPDKRYQSIKELGIELEELQQQIKGDPESTLNVTDRRGTTTVRSTVAAATAPVSSAEYLIGEIKRHKRGAALVLGVLLIALSGLAIVFYKSWTRGRPSNYRITKLTNSGKASEPAISPDGKFVAYVVTEGGQQSIRLAVIDNPASSMVLAGPTNVTTPGVNRSSPGINRLSFSPDSKSVLYYVPNHEGNLPNDISSTIYQVGVFGGAAKKLTDNAPGSTLVSPDLRRIVFSRRVGADEIKLFVADIGGTNERVLATRKVPQLIIPGAWSPDGQMLAYISSVGDGTATGTVVIIGVDSGSEIPLNTPSGWHLRRMTWLPNGSGIILAAREQLAGLDQLWEVSYPGGDVRRITNDLASYSGLSLSSDGRTLVTTQVDQPLNIWIVPDGDSSRAQPITSGKHYTGGLSWTTDNRIVYASGDTGPRLISVVAPDGTGQKTLGGDDSAPYLYPSVSHDGRSIVFVSRGRVGLMDIDGGNAKFLTSSGPFALLPQMTPDGQWVIYSSNDSRDSRLFKVPVTGGEYVEITNKPIARAVISPDGSRIACLYRETADESYKIGILPFEGGPPLKLFDIISSTTRLLRWANDGQSIYYTDERNGVSNIWQLPVESNGPGTQVTHFTDGTIRSFAWSRDGKQLAVARGTQTTDVVLITDFR